ncbi:YoaK family protein, partial [Paracoccus sp. Z118]|uniref:YoaK family protein n=1 Tax=Paracoccus sp. Z118 TaxID=2851017 RepID=UPI0020B767E9
MTGYLSQLADNLVIGNLEVALIAAIAIGAFVAGAAFSTILINWARLRSVGRQYSLPIALQGGLLICFAAGGIFTSETGRVFSLACLCFIMGMQNATITKISGARIRTTHATGMITDIGIELGREVFGRAHPSRRIAADRA